MCQKLSFDILMLSWSFLGRLSTVKTNLIKNVKDCLKCYWSPNMLFFTLEPV